MITTILATKRGMTQSWTEEGRRVPVTIVQAGPVVVTQLKTQDKDHYQAVQLGFGEKKIKNISKPIKGHLKKLQTEKTLPAQAGPYLQIENILPRYIKEARITQAAQDIDVGDVIKASDVLSPGDLVKVTGVSKGKGFAGVVKRWGFAGGPRTHGQSDRERAPGSIGSTTTPGRVLKGKKMAGRMGGERVSMKNLTILSVAEDGEVKLDGPVPGRIGGLLYIKKTGRDTKFSQLIRKGGEIHPEELPPIQVEEPSSEEASESKGKSGGQEEKVENQEGEKK